MWFNLHTYRMGIAEYDPCYVTECLTLQTTATAGVMGCIADDPRFTSENLSTLRETLSTSYATIFNN
jgi:hypothetical protein